MSVRTFGNYLANQLGDVQETKMEFSKEIPQAVRQVANAAKRVAAAMGDEKAAESSTKNASAKMGYWGARQIARRSIPRRLPGMKEEFRIDLRMGMANYSQAGTPPIPFKPWLKGTPFWELFPNGMPWASTTLAHYQLSATSGGAQYVNSTTSVDLTHQSAFKDFGPSTPTVFSDTDIPSGIINNTVNRLRLCVNAPASRIKCCRLLVIKLRNQETIDTSTGAASFPPALGYTLGDFFTANLSESNSSSTLNITAFMDKNLVKKNPALEGFKVLVDRTFTTHALQASTSDIHIDLDFPLGVLGDEYPMTPVNAVTHTTWDPSYYHLGSGRIIWGLFYEIGDELATASAPASIADVNALIDTVPSFYGDYKFKFHSVE